MTPYPEISSPGARATLFYIIQPFWLPFLFVPLSLLVLHLVPFSPLPTQSPLLTWPSLARSCLLWTLPDVLASGSALPHIY